MTGKPLRAIDLCAGAGGWACAARGLPIEMNLAVDRWDRCCETYSLNHPGVVALCADVRDAATQRDIRKFCAEHGGIDIVLGSIPCEWLSPRRMKAHNPVSEEERAAERATLAAVLHLVGQIRPTYWCMEDVKGLAKELPADVPWLELDSSHFSAQRRKRIYFGQFPAPILYASSATLAAKLRPGPYRIGPRAKDREVVRSRQFHPGLTLAASPDRKCPTVCSWGSRRDAELVVVDAAITGGRRQFEWQEAASAQGFPEEYVFVGSPSDVWKMIGQAVQIDTARAILCAVVRDAWPTKERTDDE